MLAVSKEMKSWKCSNMGIDITPSFVFNPPPPIVMGGGAETMYNPCTIHETMYYPCTWLTLVNQKSEKKNRNWILLMKIVSTVPKVLFFKTTDLYMVYLFSQYADN